VRNREPACFLLATLMLAACGGDAGSGLDPDLDPGTITADTLPAAASMPAVSAIPRTPFLPDSTEYDLGHPELPGLPHSVSTAIVSLAPDATVGAVNALLKQLNAEIAGGIPGTAGSTPGLLALRLPTTTHAAMEAALLVLRASPAVRSATQDVLLDVTEITRTSALSASVNDPSAGGIFSWDWNPTGRQVPAMATWALAAIRMPQAWNLNAQIRARGGNAPRTGVLDNGFSVSHPDLQSQIELQLLTPPLRQHGTHVTGTIGARHGDSRGIEGVNPFARLVVRPYDNSTSSFAASVWGLDDLIVGGAPLRVVNISLGYNWYDQEPIGLYDPRVPDDHEQRRANRDGEVVGDMLASLQGRGIALPVVVVAAGNDGDLFPGAEARFLSPFANAALAQGVAAIVVVEADSTTVRPATSPSYRRASFSGLGGHLSAPGSQILSADSTALGYVVLSGTSMATPHVSGVVGFLYTLDPTIPAPTLTTNFVRDLLVNSSRRGLGEPYNGRPMLDAFAAALTLDSAQGNDRVLRLLLDIDDGTEDGNTRIDPFTRAVVSTDDPLADATIDMADFRRWRDMVLALELPLLATLDGAANHPKKDLNGDGVAGTGDQENVFPRGDFNGDGRISRTAVARVPGVLSSRGSLTDLEVLQSRFDDPVYEASELDALVISGDVHARTVFCNAIAGERVRMRVSRDGYANEFFLATGQSVGALTVPVSGTTTEYDVELARVNGSGQVVQVGDTTIAVTPGGDVAVEPLCSLAVDITTGGLSGGTVGLPYNVTLSVTGGTGTYEWSVSSGQLPSGLSLGASTGVISGTPTTAGTSNVTIRATSGALFDELVASIVIGPNVARLTVNGASDFGNVVITTTGLQTGQVGRPYQTRVMARGPGSGGWTGRVTSRPEGIDCTFTESSTLGTCFFDFPIGIRVTLSATEEGQSTFVRWSPPCETLIYIPTCQVNMSRGGTVAAYFRNGSWESIGGPLPEGLTLDPVTGSITGTPTQAGFASLKFRTSGGGSFAETGNILLQILPPS